MVAVPVISLAVLWSKLLFRSKRFLRLCNTLNDVCKCCSAFTKTFGLIANLLSSNKSDASEKQMLEKFMMK